MMYCPTFFQCRNPTPPSCRPTSGLDARAAAIVMRAVRNTVNTGRTVVCTIHQPSIDIFDVSASFLSTPPLPLARLHPSPALCLTPGHTSCITGPM